MMKLSMPLTGPFEINPADAKTWYSKAELLMGLMQYEEALDAYYSGYISRS